MDRLAPPLDARLKKTIKSFASEHSTFWKAHPEVSSEWINLASQLAESLVSATDTMERLQWFQYEEDGTPRFQIEFVGEGGISELFTPFPEAQERVQILVANRFCTDTKQMAQRCLELAALAVEFDSENRAVTEYLRRLSRCYILGLLPECTMLCRAVLENALEEVYSRSNTLRPTSERGKTSLYQDLKAAYRVYGWLSDEQYEAANVVRLRGNHAVHDAPDSTGSVLETIRMTMESLEMLYEVLDS